MKKPLSILLAVVLIISAFVLPSNLSFASEQVKLKVTSNELNVRSSVWGNWMGSVYRDQEYTSTESQKDSSGDTWYAISYNGKKGWVHGNFVSVVSAPVAPPSTSAKGKLTITSNALNIRSAVWGSISDVVTSGQVYEYTEVSKDSSGDNWYKIGKGWVHGNYVKIEVATPPPAAATSLGKLTIESDTLRVRASAWGEHLTSVRRGANYDYYGTQKASDGSTWYQIEVDGRKGYVHGGYIKVAAPPAPAPTPKPEPKPVPKPAPAVPVEKIQGKIKVATATLNVRSGIWGTWIGSALDGEMYDYVSTAKDSSGKTWYKLDFGGKSGWVHGDYVSLVSTTPSTPPGTPTRSVLGTLYITTSVLNVRDAVWGNWIGQTYNSTAHDYYADKKDSSGSIWYEIAFGSGSGWVHGDFVSLSGFSGIEMGDILASSKAESNVYALQEFALQIVLNDKDGKTLTGQAAKLGVNVSGAQRPGLVSVGEFKETRAGVYQATAKISDAHQSVRFTFTLGGASLGESALVHTGASEFQERWLKQNVGVYMDLDGWNGYQCKDVLDSYAFDMFGDFRNIVGLGNAAQLYDGPSEDYFIKIPREASGPNSVPKMGDVIIYGGSSRIPAGHLSVVISADEERIYVLEQNAENTGRMPTLYATRGYSALSGEIIGWLRPRVEKISGSN